MCVMCVKRNKKTVDNKKNSSQGAQSRSRSTEGDNSNPGLILNVVLQEMCGSLLQLKNSKTLKNSFQSTGNKKMLSW